MILEIFQQYKKSIKQQAEINNDIRRIRVEYEDQSEDRIVVENLRRVMDNELAKLVQNPNQPRSNPSVQPIIVRDNFNDKINMEKYSNAVQEAIKQAQDNAIVLEKLIKQLKEQRKGAM